tara:strand:- start:32 stop:430 length:399 start_codon:yes stop_codon:yes gene_type:complete
MMQKTIFFYFLCVIFLFNSTIIYASFPVKNKIYNDRKSQSKKETVEEYKIRIQKQLYGYNGEIQNTNQKFDIHRGIFIFFLVTALVGLIIAFYGLAMSSWSGVAYFFTGLATFLVSALAMLVNFVIKIIREA